MMMKSKRSFAIKSRENRSKKVIKEIRKPFSAIGQVLGFPHDILALRTLK